MYLIKTGISGLTIEDYKNNLSQFLNDFHGNQDVIRILTNCLITN